MTEKKDALREAGYPSSRDVVEPRAGTSSQPAVLGISAGLLNLPFFYQLKDFPVCPICTAVLVERMGMMTILSELTNPSGVLGIWAFACCSLLLLLLFGPAVAPLNPFSSTGCHSPGKLVAIAPCLLLRVSLYDL